MLFQNSGTTAFYLSEKGQLSCYLRNTVFGALVGLPVACAAWFAGLGIVTFGVAVIFLLNCGRWGPWFPFLRTIPNRTAFLDCNGNVTRYIHNSHVVPRRHKVEERLVQLPRYFELESTAHFTGAVDIHVEPGVTEKLRYCVLLGVRSDERSLCEWISYAIRRGGSAGPNVAAWKQGAERLVARRLRTLGKSDELVRELNVGSPQTYLEREVDAALPSYLEIKFLTYTH